MLHVVQADGLSARRQGHEAGGAGLRASGPHDAACGLGRPFQRDRAPGQGRAVHHQGRRAASIEFVFEPDDVLLFDGETAGAPEAVHARRRRQVVIPIMARRAVPANLAVGAGIGLLFEALRQTGGLPG